MIVIYVVYLFVCFISYARVFSWFSFIIVCTSTCLHLEIKHMGDSIWNMFSSTDSGFWDIYVNDNKKRRYQIDYSIFWLHILWK
jgi:hypothetical protein